MKIFLSLLIVLIYWSLDAYQDVTNFNISFIQALFLDYAQVNPFIKITLAVSIFLLSLITPKVTQFNASENQQETTLLPEQFSTMHKISDIVFSPIPLHKQLNDIVTVLEKRLKVKTAFISSFQNDTILLLNTNDSLQAMGIKEKYLPYHNELEKNSLDNLLSIGYLEKREFLDEIINIHGIKYRAIIHAYKGSHSTKPLGLFTLLLDENDKKDYTNFVLKTCEQIAFTINLDQKKKETIEAQSKYNTIFSTMDTELHIPNYVKLQEMIEHEMKRSQRYGTELSLILIEIDYMQNLTNIFTEKETFTLQKDITSLLKKGVRETDLFGKWTENHFAIIAPDIDFREAKSFANKLNQRLQTHRFAKVGKITCSYGITSFCAKDTLGTFRQRAENALKEAISRGGNSIEIKILV
ncbi:GGDEF domain-containing protein [Sulfurospirillum arcachonense]|uniref:GGDEF domain-containing protein n=1 Tax=Sulfurospirillum arcachonense TaxID=57666 RepID=UPI000468C1EF|nr:GGDEF domain-containing protein [Sulfurospirillum arcachonense]